MALFPLGILSAAGGGIAPPPIPDYELISSTILGSTATSITFSGLSTYSSTYRHLQIRATARTNRATFVDNAAMRFNGETGNAYTSHRFYTEAGSTIYAQARPSETSMRILGVAGASAASNVFSGLVTDILDPYASFKNRTIRTLGGQANGSGTGELTFGSGAFRDIAAISSITIYLESSNSFVAGSRFSLYGIKG
jgi:hypothetical protein